MRIWTVNFFLLCSFTTFTFACGEIGEEEQVLDKADAPTIAFVDAKADAMCPNTCAWANDGVCDDGGPNSTFSVCAGGTDCSDCSGALAGDENSINTTERFGNTGWTTQNLGEFSRSQRTKTQVDVVSDSIL